MNTSTPEVNDIVFLKARTHSAWLKKAVSDETLRQAYDLMKYGPTSANGCPVRIVFVKSKLHPRNPRMNFEDACKVI